MQLKRLKYRRVALAMACVLALIPMVAAAYDWPQFNGNAQHYGNNTQETAINSGNVNTLKQLFSVTFSGENDGIPVYLGGVSTPNGVKDMLYLTMRDGSIMALDAHSGSTVWQHATHNANCTSTDGSNKCYTTSSPVIDPNGQYVYSYDHDGKIHKYQVGDGTEVTTGGWPEVVSTKPDQEKQSSALALATVSNTTYLYAATAGYNGDYGDYQGHLTTINLSTGSQHVFNALCSNQIDVHFLKNTSPDCTQKQTAIWGRPGVVYDPDTNKIYMATGNGTFNPSSFDWGDTVFALNPDGTGAGNGNPLDSYTPNSPVTADQLQSADADIGSTSPAILPTSGYPNIKYKHLGLQGSKVENYTSNGTNKSSTFLRLLNLDNLSGQGGSGHVGGELQTIALPKTSDMDYMPAIWINPADNSTWLFANDASCIAAYKLVTDSNGNPSLSQQWTNSTGGTSPLVANNVLYYASGSKVYAYNPLDGTQLWSGSLPGGIHWQSPVVANGVVYMTDGGKYTTNGGHITAFSLNGATPTTQPPTTATTTTTATTPVTTTPPTPTPTTPAPGSGPYNYVIPFLANNSNNFTTFLSIENIGNASAGLTLQYYSSNGAALTTDGNGALAANGIWNPTLKLTSGQSGAAFVTSNQPLNIVVPEATKYGGSAYTVSGSPTNSLVAPLALNGAYGFVTQLNVFNAGSSSSSVTVSFYDTNGNLQSAATQSFSLTAHSLKTIDQTAINLPANFNGWAQISGGSNDQLVAQVLEQNGATHFVAIANATTPATSLVAPAIFNRAFGSFTTGLNIVNPGNSAVTVTLSYHDANGVASNAPTFSVPAHGVQAIFNGATSGTGLPSGGLAANFAGSMTLSATGGVVMAVNEDGGTTASGSRESGVYDAEHVGKSSLSLPVMSNGAFGGYFTGSTLVNTTNQSVTVSLQYYDSNGNAVGTAHSFTIPAYGSHFNYQGGESPALPSGYYGDALAVVTSGPANALVSTANAISSQFFYTYVQP